jgi:hypothetical protein
MSGARQTPLTQMFLDNLVCFTPEQIEKISNTEPEHRIGAHKKCKFGVLAEATDFRSSGIGLFKQGIAPTGDESGEGL